MMHVVAGVQRSPVWMLPFSVHPCTDQKARSLMSYAYLVLDKYLMASPRWERRLLVLLDRSGAGRLIAGTKDLSG